MTFVNEYVMDEVSRVRNIKERFETISNTSQCNRLDKDSKLKNSCVDQGDAESIGTPKDRTGPLCANIELIANARTNIKRKPAFRRDKIPTRSTDCCPKSKSSIVSRRVRLFNDMDDIENLGVRESGSLQLTANNTSALVSESEDELKQLYSRVKKCTKNSEIGQPTLDTLNLISPGSNVHKKHVTKAKFTNECGGTIETSVSKKNKSHPAKRQLPNEVSNELSDTLKRILKCPLPSGPPPRKPPRTFAANSESSLLSEVKVQRPERSKTETEIKLKKIENALGKHQRPIFSIHSSAKKTSLGGAATSTTEKYAGINKNRRRSLDRDMTGQSLCSPDLLKDSIRPKSESCVSLPPVPSTFSVFQETDDGHIYEEPTSLNSSMTSPCEDVEVLSLYYMSVPIDSIINSSERRNVSEALNSKVKPNYVFGTHSVQEVNAKCQNDISMDNKIKLWMNEAYSNSRTKSSDGSSDSDSVFSASQDDLMSPSKEERSSGDQYSQLTLTRKGYCQKVASRAISRQHSVQMHEASDYKHLFECLLLIGLNLDVHNENVPYIKLKYPIHVDVPQSIEHMCFPDAHDWYNRSSEKASYDNLDEDRCYVIPLTNEVGLRKYAYCRRIKPEGESSSLPLSYCMLSSHKANEFYFSILEEVENRHGQSDVEFSKFIKQLHANRFPSKGQGIKITPFSEEKGDQVNGDVLMRPIDARLEDLRLAKSLAYVKINTFLLIFSSLLLERKVILLSHSISKLSTCIEGLQVALLPFEWQHTLITVVPSNVISVSDLCDAPTPYLIGLLKPKNNPTRVLSYLNNKMQILVVDLDEKKALRRVGDENSILPNHLAKGVKNALQLAHSSEMHTNNLLACEAFTRLFVEAVGHYERYIISSGDDRNYVKSFQKEAFVNHGRSHQIRMFLEWFVETAAFSVFVDVRLQSKRYSRGLFEVRCREYSDELIKSKQEKNNKLNKTVKQIGDLIKDWAT